MPIDPAGPVAGSIATLTNALFVGGALLFALVMLLLALAVARPARPIAPRVWLLGGGVLLPLLVLVPLLFDSVRRAHALTEAPPGDGAALLRPRDPLYSLALDATPPG